MDAEHCASGQRCTAVLQCMPAAGAPPSRPSGKLQPGRHPICRRAHMCANPAAGPSQPSLAGAHAAEQHAVLLPALEAVDGVDVHRARALLAQRLGKQAAQQRDLRGAQCRAGWRLSC